jgi:hypothetical protein
MNAPASADAKLAWPRILSNMLIYQTVWLACVLGAAHGMPALGSMAALLAVAWHLSQTESPLTELTLVLLTGLAGGVWDSLLVVFGLIHYPTGTILPWLAPSWIISLWLAFATTFNVCLRWLHGRFWLASLFGLLGGPLAWSAGAGLGALELVNPLTALIALGLGWALLMPGLIRLAMRFDGVSHQCKI